MATNPAPTSDTSTSIPPTPKPGLLTTEFYATVLTLLLPAATLLFHQDFSGQVQAIAAAAAGIATAAYTISRALTKSAQLKASMTASTAAATTTDAAVPAAGAPILAEAAATDAQIQAAAEQLTTLLRNAQADQTARNSNGHRPIVALFG